MKNAFEPYKYQQIIHKYFMEGYDLIVQAPTGSGKTHGALWPGLESLDLHRNQPSDYPGRIIYTTPLRSLTHGFQKEYNRLAQIKRWELSWYPTVQTGEQSDDPLFEGQVIFATIDQVLASFLNVPYGISKRLDNINAGAMIGAYLIFDEFHLYPRQEMMITVISMLKMLKNVSRFTLMTATCSPPLLDKLHKLLDTKLIVDKQDTEKSLFEDIPALNQRHRVWHVADSNTPLDANEIRHHSAKARTTLVICNVVERAQLLYESLKNDNRCKTYLLHSRFYRDHREQIEKEVLELLSPENPDGRPIIVIATQVVEVGFDISADILLTECAPAASLIQRAGRCARRSGEGHVFVYLPRTPDGDVTFSPYDDDNFFDICEKTWKTLCEQFDGKVMHFSDEQELIKLAHGEADEQFADKLDSLVEKRIIAITRCMKERKNSYIGELIRKNDTVPLFIHDNPNQDDNMTQSLRRYQAFNLSRGQIARLFDVATESNHDIPFIICGGLDKVVEDPIRQYPQRFIHYKQLKEANEAYDTSFCAFVVHPLVVQYTDRIGLRLLPGINPAPKSPLSPSRYYERFSYEAERYHEHLIGLYWAYTKPITIEKRSYICLHHEVLYPLKRLCARFKKATLEDSERFLRLTLALHDLGKLNHSWQQWARSWQKLRAERLSLATTVPLDDPTPLAHTDFNSQNEQEYELQKEHNKMVKRGQHAIESAEAATEIVRKVANECKFWMAIVLGAIIHHHSPEVDGECSSFFEIANHWEETFARSLQVFGFELSDIKLKKQFKEIGEDVKYAIADIKPQFNNYSATLFYLLFVRILRLADQRSNAYWRRYRGEYTDGSN